MHCSVCVQMRTYRIAAAADGWIPQIKNGWYTCVHVCMGILMYVYKCVRIWFWMAAAADGWFHKKCWFLYMCAYVYMYFTNMCICIAMYVYKCVHIEWPRWQTVGYHNISSYACVSVCMGNLMYVYKCVHVWHRISTVAGSWIQHKILVPIHVCICAYVFH